MDGYVPLADKLPEEYDSHGTQECPGYGETWGCGHLGGLQAWLLPGLCLLGRKQAKSCEGPRRTAVLIMVAVYSFEGCVRACALRDGEGSKQRDGRYTRVETKPPAIRITRGECT